MPFELELEHGENAGYNEIETLLSSEYEVDGIFALSDMFAMSAIRALHDADIRVPQDVAVVVMMICLWRDTLIHL